ncbi:hypothetical protein [Rhizobium anhuiense]|uniref:hypothetical protein n=1 Tax=Rhizobium anhuiense TaxID=1184720 RepID=UPI0020CBEB94|nr:hypothetical protein [Rhizobium anhuiense]UTS88162.1 hypothetical protein NE851_00775 [Rhizobium anhuiense bv. trifolii]
MNGTLAFWFEPLEEVGEIKPVDQETGPDETVKPKLELHVNLWRDPPAGVDFIDLGLKLENVTRLSRFYVLLPFLIDKSDLKDLSEVMRFGQTLDAVFNTVVELEGVKDRHYQTKSKGRPFVTIHGIDIGNDIKIEPVEDNATQTYCILTFSEQFCTRLRRAPGPAQYLRFRVELKKGAGSALTQEVSAKDKLFVSSANKLELTELRLNEQRSFPARIAQRAQLYSFSVVRVHYFLIRDLGHELVTQHAPLRKVRRLEPDLWSSYIRGESVRSNVAEKERHIAERLIIYHWREGDGKKEIEDFTAFATFRTSSPGLLFYILAIVLLGAVGSTISTLSVSLIGELWSISLFGGGVAVLWWNTVRRARQRNGRANLFAKPSGGAQI